MEKFKIRKLQKSDISQIIRLFRQTVFHINSRDYDDIQIKKWMSADEDKIKNSLENSNSFVACNSYKILGFGNIDDEFLIDYLFVDKDYQRKNIASSICDVLESFAKGKTVTVFSSITARGFFEKRGYEVIKEQKVKRDEVVFTNFEMKKF